MMKKGFGMGLLGKYPFDEEAKKEFLEKWSKMTDAEKLEFVNEKVERMSQDPFSVEAFDARCEKWMAMSQEEKQAFVDEKKKAFKDRKGDKHGYFRHHKHC